MYTMKGMQNTLHMTCVVCMMLLHIVHIYYYTNRQA